MTTRIDANQVRNIAKLARLELREDEIATFSDQLDRIIEYVDKLKTVDVTGVEPLAHPLPITDVLREDEPRPGLTSEQALANAPRREGDFFRVPAVLDPHSGA